MDTLNNENYIKQRQIHDEMNKWFTQKMVIDDNLFNTMFEKYFKRENYQCSPNVKKGIAQFFKDCLLCTNDRYISDLIDEIGHYRTSEFMMCKIFSSPYQMKYDNSEKGNSQLPYKTNNN